MFAVSSYDEELFCTIDSTSAVEKSKAKFDVVSGVIENAWLTVAVLVVPFQSEMVLIWPTPVPDVIDIVAW